MINLLFFRVFLSSLTKCWNGNSAEESSHNLRKYKRVVCHSHQWFLISVSVYDPKALGNFKKKKILTKIWIQHLSLKKKPNNWNMYQTFILFVGLLVRTIKKKQNRLRANWLYLIKMKKKKHKCTPEHRKDSRAFSYLQL